MASKTVAKFKVRRGFDSNMTQSDSGVTLIYMLTLKLKLKYICSQSRVVFRKVKVESDLYRPVLIFRAVLYVHGGVQVEEV